MHSRLENWQSGIDHFNAGRFWEAHEAWERDWLGLPPNEKLHIQILIQFAGVFYLIEKGRHSGAYSLAKTAISKLGLLHDLGGVSSVYPRVEIPGLEQALGEIETQLSHHVKIEIPKSGLARLLLSPA